MSVSPLRHREATSDTPGKPSGLPTRLTYPRPRHEVMVGRDNLRGRRSGPRNAISESSLILLTQELLALLDSGLQLATCIDALTEKHRGETTQSYLIDVLNGLRTGQAFSTALAEASFTTPPLFVALVRASELTGDLRAGLSRYLSHAQKARLVRRTIETALIYPTLLLLVGSAIVTFLLLWVVPRFARLYDVVGSTLPWGSRLLIAWGRFIAEHAFGVIALLALGAATSIWMIASSDRRARLFAVLLKSRPLREANFLYEISRFYRAAGMLMRGGISILEAFKLGSGLLNEQRQAALMRACRAIEQGAPIAISLHKNALTSEVAFRLLSAGEGGGNLGEMMERVAVFHDEEVSRWVEAFTRLFEPLVMLVVGGVIALVVVLMYLPILELAGALQ